MDAREYVEQIARAARRAAQELALTRGRAPAVTARGRKAAVRFGQGLPEAELEWIRAALAKILAK